MKINRSDLIFNSFNYTGLILIAALCVLPFIHVAAISFSSATAATAGRVGLWPVEFSTSSYEYAFQKKEFIIAFLNSLKRVGLGLTVNMSLLVITAYPLSRDKSSFPGRGFLVWFFVITMFVNGGLIPTFLVVNATHLRDKIWALVLPVAMNAYNLTILINFFRQIPKELEESAFIDGAGQWRILLQIFVPLSVPALATLTIFNAVYHWNEWFHGLIFMDKMKNYPLQSYLQTVIIQTSFDTMDLGQVELMSKVTDKTFKTAQIIIATAPILCVYPFMQRYFIKGMTLGSLKG